MKETNIKFNIIDKNDNILHYLSFTKESIKKHQYIAAGFQRLFKEIIASNNINKFNKITLE